MVILSQALHHAEDPGAALASAATLLKPRGQILILDLLKHNFDKARELYGDRWLGFAESDLHRWLEAAGFKKVEISVVPPISTWSFPWVERGTPSAYPSPTVAIIVSRGARHSTP